MTLTVFGLTLAITLIGSVVTLWLVKADSDNRESIRRRELLKAIVNECKQNIELIDKKIEECKTQGKVYFVGISSSKAAEYFDNKLLFNVKDINTAFQLEKMLIKLFEKC